MEAPQNADEVLPPVCFYFASGNECTVRPSMRRIGGGKCNINLLYCWKIEPTPEDRVELESEMEADFGKPDFFSLATKSAVEAALAAEGWLPQGKKPD